MQTYIVVADAFTRFADKPTLWRYSDMLSALRQAHASDLRGKRFVAGQGVDDLQMDHLYCLALSKGLDAEFKHWRQWRGRPMVDMAACHKHRAENVLITEPLCLETDTFVSDLVLHARNELMQDHLTGEHIQGMVLAEACRQMFLAVTELHCLRDFSPGKRYFVINEMAIRYLAFALPLAQDLGVEHLLVTQLEVLGGSFTGEVVGMPAIGEGKRLLVQRFLQHHQVDPAQCYAYGDHLSDLPMLELVGHPVVVARNDDLVTLARSRRWTTMLP